MELTIREATHEDVTAVRRVARKSWHAAHGPVIGADAVDEQLDEWYDPESVASSIDRADAPMFLAIDDGTVVGFAHGGPSEDGPADATVGRIYVVPDRWDSGYGSELLTRLFDAFRANSHESVWLAVLAENEVGRSFYEGHGFQIHEKREVELAGQPVEDLILVRKL